MWIVLSKTRRRRVDVGPTGRRPTSVAAVIALGAMLLGCNPSASQPPVVSTDIVLADFEGAAYPPAWETTGTAFGPGPTSAALPDQQPVDGFAGRGFATSYFGGDQATGTLTSPPFVINRKYVSFLIGGGNRPGTACINLLVDDRIARTSTGHADDPGGTEHLAPDQWDVSDLAGRTGRIQIVDNATGSWGHINVDQIVLTDTSSPLPQQVTAVNGYQESMRPQYHFTAAAGWLNDPNGLVHYDGEYHLFFQHNPTGLQSGNLCWGHAVGTDLMHWQQLPEAITPDHHGQIWSGSAVVDWNNTAGLQKGREKTLVAFYTAAGRPFTQNISYSNDKGRTWTKYDRNPVVGNIHAQNRDPKVVWHAESRQWVMALYVDRANQYTLLTSTDLKHWTLHDPFVVPGSDECPDFFPIDLDGNRSDRKWVFTGANGRYVVGRFDGQRFEFETPPLTVEYGDASYAVQTFSDMPANDGRRIQIGWMRGGRFPGMPFNQQMTIPCELVLKTTQSGPRLFKTPARELSNLLDPPHVIPAQPLTREPLVIATGDALDIKAEIEPGVGDEIVFDIDGAPVIYTARQTLINGKPAPLPLVKGRFKLRLLIDRGSVEAFGNDGEVVISANSTVVGDRTVRLAASGPGAKVIALSVARVRSVWDGR